MNSPAAPEQVRAASLAPARHTFNWTEYIIIPITNSIMEAQPIALLILLMPVLLIGSPPSSSTLDAGAIALILLGLHWWAVCVHALTQRPGNARLTTPLQLAGLALAWIVTFGLLLLKGSSAADLIIPGAVVIWAWRRSILWTRKETHDEQLILTFKVGFIVIAIVLVLSTLLYAQMSTGVGAVPPGNYMLTALGQALPLFFLAGLLALSFTRLEIIKRDSMRNALGVSRLDPTRTWRVVLGLAWTALVALCIALETFSLEPLRALLTPLWELALFLFTLILYIIAVVLSLFIKPMAGMMPMPTLPRPRQPVPSGQGHLQYIPGIPPIINIIFILLVTLVVLVIVFFVVRAVLQYTQRARDEEEMSEEEERENLSISAILKARRQERQLHKQQEAEIERETLDPASARARYRELLDTAARSATNLARRAHETPREYQRRLTPLLEKTPNEPTKTGEATPPGSAVLAELTDAYARERYGDAQPGQAQKSYLGTWMPGLLRRLTGAGSSQAPPAPHARLPNKWGD